jgi:hypothetical protein
MREVIEEVFTAVLDYLIGHGYVRLENYFIDGTKIEANANQYSYVWRKSTGNYKQKLQAKVREMMDEVDLVNKEEDKRYGDKDLEELGEEAEIDSEGLKDLAKRLNEKLKDNPQEKKLTKAVKKLERDYIPRMEKYERYDNVHGYERRSHAQQATQAWIQCANWDRRSICGWVQHTSEAGRQHLSDPPPGEDACTDRPLTGEGHNRCWIRK